MVIPIGLMNAPATFQCLMNLSFSKLLRFMTIYLTIFWCSARVKSNICWTYMLYLIGCKVKSCMLSGRSVSLVRLRKIFGAYSGSWSYTCSPWQGWGHTYLAATDHCQGAVVISWLGELLCIIYASLCWHCCTADRTCKSQATLEEGCWLRPCIWLALWTIM